MVIHSIEGGCPARNTPGNLPEGASPDTTADPDTYKYTIPAGVAPGAYTLAWTWFNKVGNREMYMNCASIKVTGGSGKRDMPRYDYEEYFSSKISKRAAASFPSLFVANIGTGCTTAKGGDVQFPEPGQSVETTSGFNGVAPIGSCGASGGSSSAGSASGSGSSRSGVSSASSGSPSAAPAPASAVASPAPSRESNSSDSGAVPSSNTASTGASTSSCTTPGQSICSPDGAKVGMCSQAKNVIWIKLAAGMKCSTPFRKVEGKACSQSEGKE